MVHFIPARAPMKAGGTSSVLENMSTVIQRQPDGKAASSLPFFSSSAPGQALVPGKIIWPHWIRMHHTYPHVAG